MLLFLVTWCVAAGAYLLFAGQVSADELVASIIAGFCAGAWLALLRRRAQVQFELRLAVVPALMRAVAALPGACAKVGVALFRSAITGRGGVIIAQGFDTGRQNEAHEVGRRGAAMLLASLAPDGYVVRVDKEAHCLRSHVIVPSPSPLNTKWGR